MCVPSAASAAVSCLASRSVASKLRRLELSRLDKLLWSASSINFFEEPRSSRRPRGDEVALEKSSAGYPKGALGSLFWRSGTPQNARVRALGAVSEPPRDLWSRFWASRSALGGSQGAPRGSWRLLRALLEAPGALPRPSWSPCGVPRGPFGEHFGALRRRREPKRRKCRIRNTS